MNCPAQNSLAALLGPFVREFVVAVASDPVTLEYVAKIVAAVQAPQPAPEDPSRLLSKGELAKKLSVSSSTVDRLTGDGMPIAAYVGDSRRFDLAACRGWVEQRGEKASTPKTEAA